MRISKMITNSRSSGRTAFLWLLFSTAPSNQRRSRDFSMRPCVSQNPLFLVTKHWTTGFSGEVTDVKWSVKNICGFHIQAPSKSFESFVCCCNWWNGKRIAQVFCLYLVIWLLRETNEVHPQMSMTRHYWPSKSAREALNRRHTGFASFCEGSMKQIYIGCSCGWAVFPHIDCAFLYTLTINEGDLHWMFCPRLLPGSPGCVVGAYIWPLLGQRSP